MSDLDFVKEFRKIQITRICKKVGVDYCNFISGRSSKENEKKVKEELLKQLNELLEGEGNGISIKTNY